MKTTIKRDNIEITMTLNQDETVNLRQIMQIKFFDESEKLILEKETYPDVHEGKKYGTINDQFEYAKSILAFEKACQKRKCQQ